MAPLVHVPAAPLVLNIECPNEITFNTPGQLKAVPLQTEEPMGGLLVGSTIVQVYFTTSPGHAYCLPASSKPDWKESLAAKPAEDITGSLATDLHVQAIATLL